MDWPAWEPTMRAIRAEFGYTEADDRAAAELLQSRLPKPAPHWRNLGVQLRNRRTLMILGCGPGLERLPAGSLTGKVVMAADGATQWLREQGVVPNVVVTDLDGDEESLVWAAAQGAYMVVHAHGDNQEAVRRIVPRLGPLVWGTHQVAPDPVLEPLRNLGGFTDGDRAVLLAEDLGALGATLAGFEFDQPPSKYSGRYSPATKPAKLAWAKRIVEACGSRGKLALAQQRL